MPIILEIELGDFPCFGSSLAHLEPKLELFEVWEMMVRQIIIAIKLHSLHRWSFLYDFAVTLVGRSCGQKLVPC